MKLIIIVRELAAPDPISLGGGGRAAVLSVGHCIPMYLLWGRAGVVTFAEFFPIWNKFCSSTLRQDAV